LKGKRGGTGLGAKQEENRKLPIPGESGAITKVGGQDKRGGGEKR